MKKNYHVIDLQGYYDVQTRCLYSLIASVVKNYYRNKTECPESATVYKGLCENFLDIAIVHYGPKYPEFIVDWMFIRKEWEIMKENFRGILFKNDSFQVGCDFNE